MTEFLEWALPIACFATLIGFALIMAWVGLTLGNGKHRASSDAGISIFKTKQPKPKHRGCHWLHKERVIAKLRPMYDGMDAATVCLAECQRCGRTREVVL